MIRLAFILLAVVFAMSAPSTEAAVMRVSLDSPVDSFDPVLKFFYPTLPLGDTDLLGEFIYDTEQSTASGWFGIGGYADLFSGNALIADSKGVPLSAIPSSDPSSFQAFGLWFDGDNPNGSHLFLNISVTQDAKASFTQAGWFSVAPYGYIDFGSTVGGVISFATVDVITSAPLPASLPLFGIALLGLAAVGYQRRSARV